MKITPSDLQANWLAFYDQRIVQIVRTAYPGTGEHLRKPGESLVEWIARLTELPRWRLEGEIEYEKLKSLMVRLSTEDEQQKKLKALWDQFLAEVTPAPSEDAEKTQETDDDTAALLSSQEAEEIADDAYENGFKYFAQKRQAALKNGLKWYLEYQRAMLLRLKNQAWWGKVSAVLYGLAVGISLAGYIALTIGLAFISQNLWALVIPIGLSWFTMQTNFWISRRAPSELIFDLFTSPRETENNGFFSKVTAKEWTARFLGLCNAVLYGGLTAYGMFEFFTLVGAFGTLAGAVLSGVAIFALSMMVFLPELGMGIKFIRQQLDRSPVQRYRDMCNVVGRSNKTFLGMNPYVARFWAVFACVVVGAVFTTLAAGGIVASLTGMSLPIAQLFLSVFTLTVLPFYYDKALKNAEGAYKHAEQGVAPPAQTLYSQSMRVGNAFVNAVPAFLGGIAVAASGAGIVLAVVVATAGLVASYLSGEDGAQPGYEKQINNEYAATTEALAKITANPGEPTLTCNDFTAKATQHTLLFNPFNTRRETRLAEMNVLNLNVPDSAEVKLKAV